VLNQGQKEIEVWNTLGNTSTPFSRELDTRIEFEIGLGSNLQTAFYLLSSHGSALNSSNPLALTIDDFHEYGFANEWKLKLSDPVADVIGSALYFEYTIRPVEIELEGKIILDKRIGKTLHAINIAAEDQMENSISKDNKVMIEPALNVMYNYGLSYELNQNLFIGIEAFNNNKYTSEGWQYSALYAGPCISYNQQGFWINLSCMPQVTDLKFGGIDVSNNYKFQTRLLFSYAF
jgi:hypothetical protein